MSAHFVYKLSDGAFVALTDSKGKPTYCNEVAINDDFCEVTRLLRDNGEYDARWHNREIVDIVIPSDCEYAAADQTGLLLDSGVCLFHSSSEPRGSTPHVALSRFDEQDGIRMFHPADS